VGRGCGARAPLRRHERKFSHLGPVGPFYPASYADGGYEGEAVLRCVVGPSSGLERCRTISTTARRPGFGDAALALAHQKRIRPKGSPREGETIDVRVPFDIP
jgi:outer membrane biosynthesis protein TonB